MAQNSGGKYRSIDSSSISIVTPPSSSLNFVTDDFEKLADRLKGTLQIMARSA